MKSRTEGELKLTKGGTVIMIEDRVIAYCEDNTRIDDHTRILEHRANAQHIVKIWNNHDKLVEALKMALDLLERNQNDANWYLKGHYNKLKQAIDLASS